MAIWHDADDPSPPMRLRDVLASMNLPPRRDLLRVEAGRDEEGRLTVMCACECGTLSVKTLAGDLERLPGEVGLTCDGCLTVFWVAVA